MPCEKVDIDQTMKYEVKQCSCIYKLIQFYNWLLTHEEFIG